MGNKIDARYPHNIGEGVIPNHPSIRSPWDRLYSYHDSIHYVFRYESMISAAIMQVLRILVPDYEERAQAMCENTYNLMNYLDVLTDAGAENNKALNAHPFCRGEFVGALNGDHGDECLMMCGRVNDFGTYRAEKELDVCDWDIVGSELCRATTIGLQASVENMAKRLRKGPTMEYCMVEAKGCGDRHCRIVAESREKYPMPPRKMWESFGPIATADQIKFTKEEDCYKEPLVFREESNYTYANGTNKEEGPENLQLVTNCTGASLYILPTIDTLIRQGRLEESFVDHVIRCVCEAAGKAAFAESYAKEGLRQWLGVPKEIGDNDGRVMGGHIEVVLQGLLIPYEVEAFNANEVIYNIDRSKLCIGGAAKMLDAHVAYWYGMTKTLVSAEWSLWEENSPEGKVRIKIAKKIDKFC